MEVSDDKMDTANRRNMADTISTILAETAEKAEERAHKAEAKYDRAVLADLIRRQKESDREVGIVPA